MQSLEDEYKSLIGRPPEERSADFGDHVTNKITGILIAYGVRYKMRDGWVDIITTRDAVREIKTLIEDCGGSIL